MVCVVRFLLVPACQPDRIKESVVCYITMYDEMMMVVARLTHTHKHTTIDIRMGDGGEKC